MPRRVVAFCGLPGSGKSTLARALSKATGWARIDRDELRRERFPVGGYTDADKRVLDEEMQREMHARLARGEPVILDGMTLSRAVQRDAFHRAALDVGADWLLVWLDCDATLARERVIADRNHPALDRDAALVDRVAATFENPSNAVRIDAALSTATQLQYLLAALEKKA